MTVSLTQKWYNRFGDIKLLNAYGPTEASDDVTHHIVEKPQAGQSSISIGKPVQNTHIYILDNHMNLCPIGVKGEICVAGLGVGKGYWKNEKKTNAAFVPNPFSDEIKEQGYTTLYRTGDVGYFQENGDVICMGRIDDQVKIRGFRIEPGEIERVIAEHEVVKEAVVVTHSNTTGDKKLVAFVVIGDSPISTLELKTYMKDMLPDYMVPSMIMKVDKLPLTTSGKVDKNALLNKVSIIDLIEENYVAPETEFEKQIASIWMEILSIEKVGINDSFFDLGGHSLSSLILINKIHKELNVKVSLKDFFAKPTIKLLAEYIEANLWLNKELSDDESSDKTIEKRKITI